MRGVVMSPEMLSMVACVVQTSEIPRKLESLSGPNTEHEPRELVTPRSSHKVTMVGDSNKRDGSSNVVKKLSPLYSFPSSKKVKNMAEDYNKRDASPFIMKKLSSSSLSSKKGKDMAGGLNKIDGSSYISKKPSSASPFSSTPSNKVKNSTVTKRENELHGQGPKNKGPDHVTRASVRSKIEKMGPICKSRKKAAAVFPESKASEQKELDLDNQFLRGKLFEDDNSTWLSSDSLSPSMLYGKRLSDSNNRYIDQWLVSWLLTSREPHHPFLGKGICNSFDESAKNSVEEPSSVLQKTILDADKSLMQELKDHKDFTGSDSAEHSLSRPRSSQDFTASENTSTILSTHCDQSPSRSQDMSDMNYLFSLFSLDSENTKSELDYLHAGSCRPPLRRTFSSETQSSISTVSTLTAVEQEKPYDLFLEAAGLDCVDSYEPIFWPFEQKFDLSSGSAWDFFFCMSPRRNIDAVGSTERRLLTAPVVSRTLRTKERMMLSTPPKSGSIEVEEKTMFTKLPVSRKDGTKERILPPLTMSHNRNKDLKEGSKILEQLQFKSRSPASKVRGEGRLDNALPSSRLGESMEKNQWR